MAKPRNKLLDYLAYVVLRVLAAVLQALPLAGVYHAADVLADLFYRLDRRHRLRALGHLRRSFPDWPERDIERVARASMRSLVYLGLEFLFTTRLMTPTRWRRHARLRNMGPTLRLLLEQKTGLIMVTGHFGNWEALGYTMATLGFPCVVIARRLDNPYINRYVLGQREKTRLRILDKKGAAEELDDILESRQAVAFIADQDAGRKGLFVDFFGRPASTFKSIGLMAMRHQAPIVVTYARRLGREFRFEMGTQWIIHSAEWADKDDPLRWITQTYTAALEQVIRDDPTQYLWVHRRWKHRPKGEQDPADGIA